MAQNQNDEPKKPPIPTSQVSSRIKILIFIIFATGFTSICRSYYFTQENYFKPFAFIQDVNSLIHLARQDATVNNGAQEVSPPQFVNKSDSLLPSSMLTDFKVAKPGSVRILCWVMTGPENHKTKGELVKKTWGRRCDKLIFMSSQNDSRIGAVGLPNVEEGRNGLWSKTKEAFKYVWKHHRNDYDWFLKADDDTYVILENLRHLLRSQDPTQPIYFGCRFKPFEKEYKNGYMSGGAGYVLSQEAVRKFVELPQDHKCFQSPYGNEDDEMGKCLEDAGVVPADARDAVGRHRFMPFFPAHHIIPKYGGENFWYWDYVVYPQEDGKECCSNTAISFHYMGHTDMKLMEYLVYRLRPFGFPSKSRFYSPFN